MTIKIMRKKKPFMTIITCVECDRYETVEHGSPAYKDQTCFHCFALRKYEDIGFLKNVRGEVMALVASAPI